MKSLQEIKEEIAKDFHFRDWKTLYDVDGIPNVIIDEIAKRYAAESIEKYSKRATITEKQKQQFNLMLKTLKSIKGYESLKGLRKKCEKNWGIIYGEAIEAAYENIQEEASVACKNVKPLI